MVTRLTNFLERITPAKDRGLINGRIDYVKNVEVMMCMPRFEELPITLKRNVIDEESFYETPIKSEKIEKAKENVQEFIREADKHKQPDKKTILFVGAGFEDFLSLGSRHLGTEEESDAMKYARVSTFIVSCFKASLGDNEVYNTFMDWFNQDKNNVIYTENFTRGFGHCGDPRINYLCHNEWESKDDTLYIKLGFMDHRLYRRKLVEEIKDAYLVCLYGVGPDFLTESTLLNGLISMCEPKEDLKTSIERYIYLHKYNSKEKYPILKFLPDYASENKIKLNVVEYSRGDLN